jgi:hypothetical protein
MLASWAPHFAHPHLPQTYWLLLAISQDQPRNKHIAAVRDRCEMAALEGYWVSAVLSSFGLPGIYSCAWPKLAVVSVMLCEAWDPPLLSRAPAGVPLSMDVPSLVTFGEFGAQGAG